MAALGPPHNGCTTRAEGLRVRTPSPSHSAPARNPPTSRARRRTLNSTGPPSDSALHSARVIILAREESRDGDGFRRPRPLRGCTLNSRLHLRLHALSLGRVSQSRFSSSWFWRLLHFLVQIRRLRALLKFDNVRAGRAQVTNVCRAEHAGSGTLVALLAFNDSRP